MVLYEGTSKATPRFGLFGRQKKAASGGKKVVTTNRMIQRETLPDGTVREVVKEAPARATPTNV